MNSLQGTLLTNFNVEIESFFIQTPYEVDAMLRTFILTLSLLSLTHGLDPALKDSTQTALRRATNFISTRTSATEEWEPFETPSAILGLTSANPERRETQAGKYDVLALKEAFFEIVSR